MLLCGSFVAHVATTCFNSCQRGRALFAVRVLRSALQRLPDVLLDGQLHLHDVLGVPTKAQRANDVQPTKKQDEQLPRSGWEFAAQLSTRVLIEPGPNPRDFGRQEPDCSRAHVRLSRTYAQVHTYICRASYTTYMMLASTPGPACGKHLRWSRLQCTCESFVETTRLQPARSNMCASARQGAHCTEMQAHTSQHCRFTRAASRGKAFTPCGFSSASSVCAREASHFPHHLRKG